MSKQTPKQQSLCNNKFDGLMNAAPHKRYKSFAVTVADWESVWLDCDPNQPLPDESVISVWPEEMFAAAVCTDKPFFKMDVHDFCDLLGAHPDATIRVFPNGKNWTDTAAEDLLEDVLEELDRVELGRGEWMTGLLGGCKREKQYESEAYFLSGIVDGSSVRLIRRPGGAGGIPCRARSDDHHRIPPQPWGRGLHGLAVRRRRNASAARVCIH